MPTFRNPPSPPSPLNDAVPKPVADRETPRLTREEPRAIQHRQALAHPRTAAEMAFVRMYDAWRLYAQTHARTFDHRIGEDTVLGPAWVAIGRALQALLDGDVGTRIDCGTMWSTIRDYMAVEGWTEPETDAVFRKNDRWNLED